MTPGARIAAAAEVLDSILDGDRAEVALTRWARRSRFAGSKDRAAIRDLVFDALRCRRSYAQLGGALTGRALMIGALRAAGVAPETFMTGEGYMMAPPAPEEAGTGLDGAELAVRGDMPDWAAKLLLADHGAEAEGVMMALRGRAPVFLRVNLRRGTRAAAIARLADDAVLAEAHRDVATALRVTENARRIKLSKAFEAGLVELQDAASQAAMLALPVDAGMAVLDYCAGGGGKSLALADMGAVVTAHDAIPARLADVPVRAARAGVEIAMMEEGSAETFDLVLVDAPCSGSGSWRRDPDAKWRLTPDDLDERTALQAQILTEASARVRSGGTLAYATCSVLRQENADQAASFLALHAGWRQVSEQSWFPDEQGDGFYLAQFQRA